MVIRFFLILISAVAGTALLFYVARLRALHTPIAPPRGDFFAGEGFKVVAHRGGALEAPENTLLAFDRAAQIAPEVMFEMDVHLSADGVPVVIHDETVDRTTNGTGPVKQKTVEELKKLDAGFRFQDESGDFPHQGKGVQIPTLQEVLERFPDRKMILEIKSAQPGAEKNILDVIDKTDSAKRVMLGSKSSTLINRFRKKNSHLNYCASHDEVLRAVLLASVFLEPLAVIPSDAFLIPERDGNIRVMTDRLLQELRRRSRKTLIWTVDSEEDMRRLISQGVDGLISDRPSLLYKVAKGQ